MFWNKKPVSTKFFNVADIGLIGYERLVRNFLREPYAASLLNEIDQHKKRLYRVESSRNNGGFNDHTDSYNLLYDFSEAAAKPIYKRNKYHKEISILDLLAEVRSEWQLYREIVEGKIDDLLKAR